MTTTPDVFIIESLRFEDEEAGYPEGHFLSHILRLSGRKVRYVYIRTRAEFEAVLDQFEDSNFRYLHLSCHANKSGIGLTLDDLSLSELGELLRPVIDKRRVFLSACELATPALATELLKDTECYSVIGPSKAIDVDESALFWASVYHLLFRGEASSIKSQALRKHVGKTADLFSVRMRYFKHDASAKGGWREVQLEA